MAYIGQLIGNRYRITDFIDEGGTSKVYLAVDENLGKEWAIKEISRMIHGKDNLANMEMAVKEASVIKGLDHPGIVRIVDIIIQKDAAYIIEDYIKGTNLGDMLKNGTVIKEQSLLDWAKQICEVLVYLHGLEPKIIYRDMKPDNLILSQSGHIKLVDFGIARRFRLAGRRDTDYLGTAQYAAPEQYEDSGMQTDERTDIYGLGCTLRYLSGSCPDISEELKEIIQKCTQQSPKDRYGCAVDLLEDLKKISGEGQSLPRKLFPVALMMVLVAALLFSGLLPGSNGNEAEENMQGAYRTYFYMLQDYLQKSLETKGNAMEILDCCGVVAGAVLEYAGQFRENKVPERDVELLLDEMYEKIVGINLEENRTSFENQGNGEIQVFREQNAKGEEVESRCGILLEKLEDAYVAIRKEYEVG